ncbi:MAG: outer rane lipoprotein [Xanthomonadaceae bacterium]|nr:outer rane lipoprotein [Xanthomonadaceae bacterium]
MPIFRRFRVVMLAALWTLAGCASAPAVDTGPELSLRPLMGTWYVIAHVPYFTERGHVWAHDDYALLPDGRIAVHYTYRSGFHGPVRSLDAVATVVPGTGNRDWRLRFFRVVPATQRIVEVAPDGSWMLLATPDRELAWIFARTPDMRDSTYQTLLHKLRDHGINSDKIWRIAQTPEQVGQLGFERPNGE